MTVPTSKRQRQPRVLLVHRKSLYQIYVQEHNVRQIKRALHEEDQVAAAIKRSHDAQSTALEKARRSCLELGLAVTVRWRANLRAIRNFDLVISLGGDGTLLDTARRITDGTLLLGINSDPQRSIGSLCCGTVDELPGLLRLWREGRLKPQKVARMRVRVDGLEDFGPVLNDVLFAHVSPAMMSRFDLAICPVRSALSRHSAHKRCHFTHHRSSGIWVSTAVGSTAAIHSAGGVQLPPDSRQLQFLVREPFVAIGDSTRPIDTHGFIEPGKALILVNRMRRATIWADGGHRAHVLQYGQQIILDHHQQSLNIILAKEA